MSTEGHSGFEDGRGRSSEAEFEPGADDASFDVAFACFTYKQVGQLVLNADERPGRNASAQHPPDVIKIDVVFKILLFQVLVVTAVFRLSFHNR